MKDIYLTATLFILFCCLVFFITINCCLAKGLDTATFEVVIKVDMSDQPLKGEANLWLPYPVSTRYQQITDIDIKGTFNAYGIYAEPRFGNMLLYAAWPQNAKEKTLFLRFKVKRDERTTPGLFDLKKGCIDRGFFAPFLKGCRLAPLTPEIVDLARQITQGKTTVMQKARAIYDWICDNMERDPSIKGCGSGNVRILLHKKKGKCVDIHSVFVTLLKGAGVPAREVFGLRLPRHEGTVEINTWQHCWAEFYVPGAGWVAADPADYLKALLEKRLSSNAPEAKALKEYYFGQIDPYRVRLSIGRDITLNPPQKSGPINYLMYPYAEIGGDPVDYLDQSAFAYSIVATRVDLH